jgi:hypothetical protein
VSVSRKKKRCRKGIDARGRMSTYGPTIALHPLTGASFSAPSPVSVALSQSESCLSSFLPMTGRRSQRGWEGKERRCAPLSVYQLPACDAWRTVEERGIGREVGEGRERTEAGESGLGRRLSC